jgi:hypothetical protein
MLFASAPASVAKLLSSHVPASPDKLLTHVEFKGEKHLPDDSLSCRFRLQMKDGCVSIRRWRVGTTSNGTDATRILLNGG